MNIFVTGHGVACHLAAIDNTPMCNFNPAITLNINHKASVRLDKPAKEAEVGRFLCSDYRKGEKFD